MYVLSIHIEGAFFKTAILSVKGKRMAIESLQEGLIEDFNLQEILQPLGDVEVELISALSPDQVMVRLVPLPVKQMRQAKKAIEYQIGDLFPFKVDEATILRSFRKTPKGIEATLVGHQNTELCRHLQEMKALGIDPDWTSSIAHGLRRFAETFAQEKDPFILFHFGWEESYLIFERENRIQKALSIPFGQRHIIDLLPDKAEEPITRPVLEDAWQEGKRKKTPFYEQIEAFEKKLRRVFEFFTQEGDESVDVKVFYTGADEMGRFLSRQLIADEKRIQMIPHLQFRNDHLLDYAITVGLCLDVIEQDRYSIQFRRGGFESERTWTSLLQTCKKYAVACAVCSSVLYLCFQGAVRSQRGHLRKKTSALIEHVQEHKTTYPQLVSLQSLVGVKRDLAKLLQKQKKLEADCRVPFLVSECLQWLSQNSNQIDYFTKVDFENQESGKAAKLHIAFVAPKKELAREFTQELGRNCPYTVEEISNPYPLQRENEYGISLVIVQ